MNQSIISIFIAMFVLFSVACKKNANIDPTLVRTLTLAGDNEEQLRGAINFYASPKDSLKRKAAVFLVRNMYLYEGVYGKDIDQYQFLFRTLDTVNYRQTNPVPYLATHLFDSLGKNMPMVRFSKLPDSKIVSTAYLIQNIELAFMAWEKMPWSRSVCFADFCEYILPYRFRTEKLEIWRPKMYLKYGQLGLTYENRRHMEDVFYFLKKNIDNSFKLDLQLENFFPFDQGLNDLSKSRTGSCSDQCAFRAAALRGAGIPVALDFIPHWGNIAGRHTMVKLINDKGETRRITNQNQPVNTYDIVDASMDYNPTRKIFKSWELPKGMYIQYNKTVPKVYRFTYSAQTEMEKILNSADSTEIAPFFSKTNIKDVSDEYLSCSTVTLASRIPLEGHSLAYLCTFNITGWDPVAVTKINKDKTLTFSKMGRNIVYLPAVYENHQFVPVNHPFYIDSMNKTRTIIPDRTKKQTLRLLRKYQLFVYTANHSLKLTGGRFEGSDDRDFKHASLLYKIDNIPFYMNRRAIRSSQKAFRYVRYLAPPNAGGNIAEVEFYGLEGKDTLLLKGSAIGEIGNQNHGPEKAFDHNMDSYYESNSNNCWVGIDLGLHNTQRIVKIGFCPRNDTNCIIEGSNYELFYWNEGWISLGSQKANADYLIYRDAPSGAIFWLKCLDGGKEERIFTYENDLQSWW